MTVDEFKAENGYEIQGMWLPRVTSVTKVISKPGLFYYYANHRNYYTAQETLNCAAEWGTLIHNSVESLLRGKDGFDARVVPTIFAFEQWRKSHDTRILSPENDIEKQICDFDNHYAGTLDILMEIDGVLGVVDIKSGTSIWDEYSLQLAAYLNAYNKSAPSKQRAKKRWILRLDQYEECELCGAKKRNKMDNLRITGGKRDCFHRFSKEKGTYEFKELMDYSHDLEGFLNAKNLWEWSNKGMLKRISNYPKNRQTLKLL